MKVVNALIAALLLPFSTGGCATSLASRSHSESSPMEQHIYTLGAWHVQEGRQSEFIAAWKDLGTIFASLPNPPSGKGILIQSTTQPTLFYSFGPWHHLDHVAAMRDDPRAQAGIEKLRALCTEATPGAFRVVAESLPTWK
jgi:hypothetical protein